MNPPAHCCDPVCRAVSLQIAQQYVDAFGKLAKSCNTVLLPSNMGDVAAMVAQAMSIYGTVSKGQLVERLPALDAGSAAASTDGHSATAVAAVAAAPPSKPGRTTGK